MKDYYILVFPCFVKRQRTLGKTKEIEYRIMLLSLLQK